MTWDAASPPSPAAPSSDAAGIPGSYNPPEGRRCSSLAYTGTVQKLGAQNTERYRQAAIPLYRLRSALRVLRRTYPRSLTSTSMTSGGLECVFVSQRTSKGTVRARAGLSDELPGQQHRAPEDNQNDDDVAKCLFVQAAHQQGGESESQQDCRNSQAHRDSGAGSVQARDSV